MFTTMIAEAQVRALTKVLGVPVLATPMGKGCYFLLSVFLKIEITMSDLILVNIHLRGVVGF